MSGQDEGTETRQGPARRGAAPDEGADGCVCGPALSATIWASAGFLRDVNRVRTVGHGGSANGQFAELLTVPERNLAVVSLANSGPGGIPFNQAAVRWALQTYLGVVDRDPEPSPEAPARAREGRTRQGRGGIGVDKNPTVVFPAPLTTTSAELGTFLAREAAAARPADSSAADPVAAKQTATPAPITNGSSAA